MGDLGTYIRFLRSPGEQCVPRAWGRSRRARDAARAGGWGRSSEGDIRERVCLFREMAPSGLRDGHLNLLDDETVLFGDGLPVFSNHL